MTDIRLHIDQVPLSVNRILGMHWSKRQRYNRSILDEMFLAKNDIGLFGLPRLEDVTVSIEVSYFGRVPMDHDNLVASCKPVIDALVKLGILLDDNPKVIKKLTVSETQTCRADTGVSIVIQDAEVNAVLA